MYDDTQKDGRPQIARKLASQLLVLAEVLFQLQDLGQDAGLHVEVGVRHYTLQQTHRSIASLRLEVGGGLHAPNQPSLDKGAKEAIEESAPLLLFGVHQIPFRFHRKVLLDLVQFRLEI